MMWELSSASTDLTQRNLSAGEAVEVGVVLHDMVSVGLSSMRSLYKNVGLICRPT